MNIEIQQHNIFWPHINLSVHCHARNNMVAVFTSAYVISVYYYHQHRFDSSVRGYGI